MNLKIKPYFILIFVVTLISLTGIRGISSFGELSGEAYIYPLLVLLPILILFKKPNKTLISYALFLFSYIFLVFIVFLSLDNVFSGEFKSQKPIIRFFSQLVVLVFFILVASYLSRVDSERFTTYTRDGYRCGFYVFLIFSFFELLSWVNADLGLNKLINNIIREESSQEYIYQRLRGSQFESPSAAMYLNIVFPWLIVFSKNLKSKIFIFSTLTFLIFITNSRTGLILLLSNVVFMFYLMKHNYTKKFLVTTFSIFSFLLASYIFGFYDVIFEKILSLGVGDEDNFHNASNIARWGSQYATLAMFYDNIFFGVGLGQAGFFLPDYYPSWALDSWNVINWMSPNTNEWPPIFSIYTKILAELGLVGFVCFMFLFFLVFKKIRVKYKKIISDNSLNYKYCYCFYVNYITCLVIFLQYGSFRFLPFWLCVSYAFSKENDLSHD